MFHSQTRGLLEGWPEAKSEWLRSVYLHHYSAIHRAGMPSNLPSPRSPLELLWDQQDLSLGPERQVSDQTQALFKAVSGAALKRCSDRLTA